MSEKTVVAAFVAAALALVVAAAAGFRGGRIFPAVFIGAAAGLVVQSLVPDLPVLVAVACGVLGAVLAVGRDGWLALFIAVIRLANSDAADS